MKTWNTEEQDQIDHLICFRVGDVFKNLFFFFTCLKMSLEGNVKLVSHRDKMSNVYTVVEKWFSEHFQAHFPNNPVVVL